jgi:hypothetical protein
MTDWSVTVNSAETPQISRRRYFDLRGMRGIGPRGRDEPGHEENQRLRGRLVVKPQTIDDLVDHLAWRARPD